MGIVGALDSSFNRFHELCHSLLQRIRFADQGITLFIFGGVAEWG